MAARKKAKNARAAKKPQAPAKKTAARGARKVEKKSVSKTVVASAKATTKRKTVSKKAASRKKGSSPRSIRTVVKQAPQRSKKKRLKKADHARAVAKAEAILQAERDKERKKREEAKARVQAAEARKKERVRQAKARKRAEEKAAKARELQRLKNERDAAREAVRQAREAARQSRLDERAREAANREAARREREAEKEANRRKKESDKAAAARERQENAKRKLAEREAAAIARAEAKQAKALDKAEAKRRNELQNQARAEAKKRLKELERAWAAAARDQRKRLGASLPQLVVAAVRVLSQRPDLVVELHEVGPAEDPANCADPEQLPVEIAAWYRELGALGFRYRIGDQDDRAVEREIALPSLSQVDMVRFAESGSFEAFVRKQLEGLVWSGAGVPIAEMAAASVPRFTPQATLVEAIGGKGVPDEIAVSLVRLYGESAWLLLHQSETEEGRRRMALRKEAATFDHDSDELDSQLISALNHGSPVQKREWEQALEAHQAFLAAGGAGGTWHVEVQEGLPNPTYAPPGGDRQMGAMVGQAVLRFENLTGLRLGGVRLSSADLCAVRAKEVNFSKADLAGSLLRYANLEGADFRGSNLAGCDFTRAKLAAADFRHADLTDTNFENADLSGANFAGAKTSGTKFGGATVRGIKY